MTTPTTSNSPARQWRVLQTTARAWGLAWMPRNVPALALRWAV